MARRVGYDELASGAGKKAVGHINGDALLTLSRQSVDQQGEVDLVALGAVFF